MVRECLSMGIIPLTPEDFEAKTRRIYKNWMKHRAGDYRPEPLSTFENKPINS